MAKRITKKDTAAKTKIANLLKDSNILSKKEEVDVDVLEKNVQDKGNDWLSDQINTLNSNNEDLKDQLQKAMGEIAILKNSPNAPVGVKDLKEGIIIIFKDLEDAHFGRNKERKIYPDANIKILLSKFLATFPFIMKK